MIPQSAGSNGVAGDTDGVERSEHMRQKIISSFGLICIALVAFSSCGSESSGATSKQAAIQSPTDETGIPTIFNRDTRYSIEEFEAAGYKKVTHFDLESLPGANDAWFGFFDQKDIEIRFYPSHQMVLDKGVEPAEIAIGRGAVPWQKRPPVRFDAYVIVGNVVMLCELDVTSCENLISLLK